MAASSDAKVSADCHSCGSPMHSALSHEWTMARYALAAGSKETPPFIRIAAVRPVVVVPPLAAQHFLNFFELPQGHGSFRPIVIFQSFGRTTQARPPAETP